MTDQAAPTGEESLGHVLGRLSGRMRHADPGTLAELRRIVPENLPAAFWRLYLEAVPREWREPRGKASVVADRAWAAVVRGLVELGPTGLDFRRRLGVALAESSYSEARFIRLIRARGADLGDEFRVASTWLANKGVAANVTPVAEMVLGHSCGEFAARTKPGWAAHQIARDYFSVTARS